MEGKTSIAAAREILGKNFLGPNELSKISFELGIAHIKEDSTKIPPILYSINFLARYSNDYILILGISEFKDGSFLTINKMRSHFGVDPLISEPCFYNQDWYLKEEFAESRHLSFKWYLLKKTIVEESRGILPETFQIDKESKSKFPSAILCTFTFFANYLLNDGSILWSFDYVWTSDIDHNGDQVYVGKYCDAAKINNNGFSVHRHLSIRNNYGIITEIC